MDRRAARAWWCGMGRCGGWILMALWLGCGEEDPHPDKEEDPAEEADGGAFEPEAAVLTAFDPAALELPEGISADSQGDLYVTLAGTGVVMRVSPAGEATPVATITLPPPLGDSFIAGITHGADDAMYVAVVSADAEMLATGIHRIPAGGGEAALFASDEDLTRPNALAWDDEGGLFVSDTASGAIFKAGPDGQLALWVKDPSLHGDRAFCDSTNEADAGANGLAFVDGDLYVANSDLGSIVRITAQSDGSAGQPTVWVAPDCSRAGLDGLAYADGVIYGAVYRHNTILAVDADGQARAYAEGEIFDNPASLVLWTGRDKRELAITNFALDRALAGEVGKPGVLTLSLPPAD